MYNVTVKGQAAFIYFNAKTDKHLKSDIKRFMNAVRLLKGFKRQATITLNGCDFDVQFKFIKAEKRYQVIKIGMGITGTLLLPNVARALNPRIYEELSEILTDHIKTHVTKKKT